MSKVRPRTIAERRSRLLGRLCAIAVAILPLGCTPRQYRQQADAEAYGIIQERTQNPLWWTPPFSVQPPPESRNFDPFDPDKPPMPPDDPAAHHDLHSVDGRPGYRHWHQWGDATEIESPCWYGSLELSETQQLQLNRERAVELGLLHSREYQFQLENLYLSALDLSLERFAFQVQWFGGNTTTYRYLGSHLSGRDPADQSSQLLTSTGLGFSRAFTAGGQLIVDVANTLVWEFSGADSGQSLSTVSVGVLQPLMRGAFRDIRLEPLTQSERSMLYIARDYARFRKQFYFDVVSGQDGYLALLLQLQAIRNLEANLHSLERNLQEHEALARAGIISVLRVDQVFQSYQSGRLQLIRARNDFQTALDRYKTRLGLPPELDVSLDDSLLSPFELNSVEVERLQNELNAFLVSFRELENAPDLAVLEKGWNDLRGLQEKVQEQRVAVLSEWEKWASRGRGTEPDPAHAAREKETQRALQARLEELRADLEQARHDIEAMSAEISSETRLKSWDDIQRMSRRLAAKSDDLFVVQSQIRAYLIELEPLEILADDAIPYALDNRLDLMNRQAEVVDAWRHVHVAQNALKADVDLFANATLGTPPGTSNPAKFSSDASRVQLGLRFDSPLNRRFERNNYRAQQVEYQRARRRFIAARDSVVQVVRLDLRQLEADRVNFEIARQSLIVAARQVELARIQLSAPKLEGDSSSTQDALNALNSLLDAKNALIAVWVSYETNRLKLLLDTESLQLDERGFPQYDDLNGLDEFESLPPGRVDFANE